ncbi:MAG TPA: hypothetical protein VM493_07080 [Vicinamibacterales bacterium]|nr:hypothetical protein [Vicinamibacterales bacterium]
MRSLLVAFAIAASVLPGSFAQTAAAGQMPDPRQMSGVPLPTGEIPAGTVTVRVIRGSLTNIVTSHPVELVGQVQAAGKTNDQGRAEFSGLKVGSTLKAVTTVDGQRLESQEFTLPPNAGIRIMLVAAEGAAAGIQEAPAAAPRTQEDQQLAAGPAKSGIVVLGEQSRLVIELGDGGLSVFNIFEIQNTARTPVQPVVPIVFPVPAGSTQLAMLDGSSPLAVAAGDRVNVSGPFPPGVTSIQFAYTMPYSGGSTSITQRVPAGLAGVSVAAQKVGAMTMTSPQLTQQRVMTADGQTYMVGQGPPIAAGSDITLAFTGLPHAPVWPRNTAVALAVLILLAGTFAAVQGRKARGVAVERQRLETERERLFAELTVLEAGQRAGTADPAFYAARRRELVIGLERIYAALDEEVAA